MDPVARSVFELLLNSLWQGTLLTLLVASILRALAGLNAATRYAVWCLTLLAVTALPWMTWSVQRRTSTAQHTVSSPQPAATVRIATARQPTGKQQKAVTFTAPPAPMPVPSAADRSRPPLQLPAGHWAAMLLAAWGTGVVLFLIRVAFAVVQLNLLKRNSLPASSGHQERLQHWVSTCGIRRPIRLGMSGRISTPVAAGLLRPVILLPHDLLEKLTTAEFDQLCLHELAHIRRWDDWTHLAQKLAGTLFFFHPAIHWIGRRLDVEREIACDDWVVAQTGHARPYAACLTRLVELAGFVRRPMLAAGAAGKKQIFRRIELLLDKSRNSGPSISKLAMSVVAVLVFLGMLQFSRFGRVVGLADMNFTRTQSYSDGATSLAMCSRGDMEFTEDETDLKWMSAGARLEIERKRGWKTENLELWPGPNGVIERRYLVGGIQRPFDPEGKQLLASVLTEIVRESGTSVPQRVKRILEQRGTGGVFEEIERIQNDRSRRLHLEELTASAKLDTDGLRRAMRLAGALHSDTEKARFLMAAGPAYLKDGLRDVLFEAMATLHSDSEKRRVLEAVLEDDGTAQETLIRALRVARGMHSDSEKAHVLVKAAGMYSNDPSVRSAFFKVVETMHSDNERRRVLMPLLQAHGGDSAVLVEVLRVGQQMLSENEKSMLLMQAINSYAVDPAVRQAFFQVAGTLHSDSERRRVLAAMVEQKGLDAETLVQVLKTAASLNSENEKAMLLLKVLENYSDEAAVRDGFFEAAATLHSPAERRRVLSAFLKRSSPGKETGKARAQSAENLAQVLRGAAALTSDAEKANLLSETVQQFVDVEPARRAFFEAVSTMHSPAEIRRVLSELLKREDLSSETLVEVVRWAARIPADAEKAMVLAQVADRHGAEPSVRSALRAALENIHSPQEYRRVASLMLR